MAEYYPLISRAVAGLRTGTPEARQAIYDRARQALVAQLRAMDPPVPEEAIARETAALDEAIARAEAEGRSDPPPEQTAPKPAPSAPPPPRPPLRPRPPLPPASEGPRGMPALGGAQRGGVNTGSAAPTVARPPVSVRREPPKLDAIRPKPTRPLAQTAAVPTPSAEASVPEPEPTLPAVNNLTVEPVPNGGPTLERANEEPARQDDVFVEDRSRDDGVRPAAPRPVEERRPNLRVWIVAAVALAAVIAIGITAWRLRDTPEELARAPAVVQPAESTAGKIVERADGSASATSEPDGGTVVASDQATQTATEPAAAPPSAGTATPQPVQSSPDPTAAQAASSPPVTAATAPAAATPPSSAGDLALPVAYKAAVLVDAPDTQEKVKTYVGTVIWRSASVPQGQGQPLATEIQADIDIPDAKARLSMQIRRNTEAQLPASHTIDLKFTLAADSPLGTIKQINVPQMRQPDMPTGDPLAGIPVTIADNYFLIGLMRGPSEERNLDLLRSRQWFDIPMLLANGKASKITFEKGASGNKIFADVLDGWKNAAN